MWPPTARRWGGSARGRRGRTLVGLGVIAAGVATTVPEPPVELEPQMAAWTRTVRRRAGTWMNAAQVKSLVRVGTV